MFNCTIAEWTKDAALTASAHPRIRFLYLVRVNFQDSILPDGMTDTQLPQTLVDIELCVANLKELPDDLHEKWPSGGYIDLEASNLNRFPPTLTKMSFLALSLAGNTITTIPSSIFEDDGLFSLSFRGNPSTSLPNDVVYNAGRFTRVSLEYSSLSVIPVWMEAPLMMREIFIDAGYSPLCDAIQRMDDTRRMDSPWLEMINCQVNFDRENMFIYPLQEEQARSALAL